MPQYTAAFHINIRLQHARQRAAPRGTATHRIRCERTLARYHRKRPLSDGSGGLQLNFMYRCSQLVVRPAFRVRHSRGEMYIGHGPLSICLSSCALLCGFVIDAQL